MDLACAYFGIWCGETCVIVPGAPYDPVTGKINLVGFETQMGCDGAFCSESFPFAKFGDLRLSEGPPLVPALPSAGTFALLAALLVAGVLGVRR